jgi:transcriptional regulator with XRE-family HTH domain
MGIYDRAKDACRAANMSIQAVERLAGLGNGAISKWNNVTPRSDALFAVARILRVSPYWLLYGEDQSDGNVSEIVALAGTPSAEYLQRLKDDPNIRMMFDLASDATKEEVEDTVRFLQFLRHKREGNNESP